MRADGTVPGSPGAHGPPTGPRSGRARRCRPRPSAAGVVSLILDACADSTVTSRRPHPAGLRRGGTVSGLLTRSPWLTNLHRKAEPGIQVRLAGVSSAPAKPSLHVGHLQVPP